MNFKRYLKLLHFFIRQNTSREFQYRNNLIFVNLNSIAWSLMRLMYYTITFSVVTVVGEWDYIRSIILAGIFMIVQGLYKTFFEQNLRAFIHLIYEGDLDYILTKPVSSQFYCSFRLNSIRSLNRVLLGICLLIFGITKSPNISILNITVFSLMIICSLFITYSISFIIITTSFYLGYVTPLSNISQVITSMTYLPYNIFNKPINTLITWVIPLMFITTIPAQMLFAPKPILVLSAIIIAAVSTYASHLFWNFAIKSYSSASS